MNIGLQIPSFKYLGGTTAIRTKLKEIVTTAEESVFYSLWVMDHFYQIKGLFGKAHTDPMMEAYTTLGYFAGLQLAALSMQSCKDIPSFVSDFAGSHHYVMDYLAEEVLKQQPKPVGDFLLQTSILDRLCGPLCAAVVAAGLAPKVGEVYGFDASAAMLDVASRNLAAFPNVELHEAPGDHLPLTDSVLDGVFANMYLHHSPKPPAAIKEMVRVLKPGGRLCITDLDTHDHTWQREQMADLWLGFERDDIRKWFADAGLIEIDVDCAEGTCNACGPDGTVKPLSIFVALGTKPT